MYTSLEFEKAFKELKSTYSGELSKLKKKKVAVIHAAEPDEYSDLLFRVENQRPFKSYKACVGDIAWHLGDLGFTNVIKLDEITLIKELLNNPKSIDFAWLHTGGVQGLDSISQAPSILQMFGIPYVGHSPKAYAVGADKTTVANIAGIYIPEKHIPLSLSVNRFSDLEVEIARYLQKLDDMGIDLVIVKPAYGRGSVDVSRNQKNLKALISITKDLLDKYDLVRFEEFLPGIEYTITMFSYDEKVIGLNLIEKLVEKETGIFASIDKELVSSRARMIEASELKRKSIMDFLSPLYLSLGLTGPVRVDMREDAQGNLKIIDLNTKPDLSYRLTNGERVTNLSTLSLPHGFEHRDLIEAIILSSLSKY